jgi:hypothetical protein
MTTRLTYGGLSAGPMPAADREWVERETRARCGKLTMRDIWPTEKQMAESAALAIDLYETAVSYGVVKSTTESVISFIDCAIDAIRGRDRQ